MPSPWHDRRNGNNRRYLLNTVIRLTNNIIVDPCVTVTFCSNEFCKWQNANNQEQHSKLVYCPSYKVNPLIL